MKGAIRNMALLAWVVGANDRLANLPSLLRDVREGIAGVLGFADIHDTAVSAMHHDRAVFPRPISRPVGQAHRSATEHFKESVSEVHGSFYFGC